MKAIKLHCLGCGRRMNYARDIDPDIPARVVRIESTNCDRCDDGGFGEEHWFDAENREVIPEWAVEDTDGR